MFSQTWIQIMFAALLAGSSSAQDWDEEIGSLVEVSAGRDAVSYNQWLATSVDLHEEAEPIEIRSLTLRARVVVPNANVYVAIHETAHFRPAESEPLMTFASIGLGSAEAGSASSDFVMTPLLEPDEPIPTLEAGNRYWVVFGVEEMDFDKSLATGFYEWDFIGDSAYQSEAAGLSVGNSIATSNTAGQGWVPAIASPQSFSLGFVAVPEPQVFGLLMLTLTSSIFLRCRRLEK